VATVLGATLAPGTPVLDRLASFVRVRQLLLVVDNCEHLTEAVAELVTRVLEAGPETSVLATSRAPLHLPGEFRRPVEPLELPPPETTGHDLALFDSVRLFTDRALDQAALPVDDESLVTVGEICRHLDGIPLAIELAAARASVLGPTELLERLSHRLDALAGARTTATDARHHTLRAALDWSYELLDEPEQLVFDQLAVFPADFDLPAAEAVASSADVDAAEVLDLLSRLVDASMVTTVATHPDERRFRLLETMTEYGREHLDEERFEELRRRHTVHYRELAADAGAAMEGRHEAEAVARIGREDHNIRPAIEWSLSNEARSTTLEFANAIGQAWFMRDDLAELVRVLETMLQDDDGSEPGRRAWALLRLIWPTLVSGDPDRGFAALAESIELSRLAGDLRLQAVLSYHQGQMLTVGTGDVDAALPHYEHSLALCSQLGLEFERASPIIGTAQALALADRTDGLAEMLDEAESILTATPDHYRFGNLLMVRAMLCWATDDLPGMIDAATEGIRHSRAARATNWEQANLVVLGGAHLFSDDRIQAEGLLLQAARLALDDGNILQVGIALHALCGLAAAEDHPTAAARLLGASATLVPFWPLMARRYGPLLDRARDELGDRFDAEVEAGRHLTPQEAVALALDPG
jgi:non-specific serine/threonine protein kinase